MAKKKQKTEKESKKTQEDNKHNNGTTAEQVIENEDVAKETDETKVSEIDELKAQVTEQKDKFLRLYAEFENYKKRTLRERIDMMNTAAQDTMTAILPVLDDFDRAKKNADDENNAEVFSEGVLLIYNKLHSIMKEKGLEVMDTEGKDFDPEFHEALSEIPVPDKKMKGKIVDTIEKGYFLKGKIIRHAKVVIGK